MPNFPIVMKPYRNSRISKNTQILTLVIALVQEWSWWT